MPEVSGFRQLGPLLLLGPHVSFLDGIALFPYRETGSVVLLVAKGTAFREAGRLLTRGFFHLQRSCGGGKDPSTLGDSG